MTRTAGRRRKNRFAAFDFAEEDERVEKEAKKLVSKFKQNECRLSGSPIDKYTFLQSFAPIPPQKLVTSNTTIDLDDDEVCVMKTQRKKVDDRPIDLKVAQGSETRQKGISNRPIEHDAKVVRYQLAQGAKSRNSEISIGPIDVDAEAEEDDIIKVGASGQDYEGGVGVISNGDDLIEMEGPQSAKTNTEVIIFPDFIMRKEIYCTKAQLTFSDNAFKVEGSAMNGTDGTFSFEWAIDDIVSIQSEWCGRVKTACICLVLRSKDSKTAGNANETSGIENLRFSVYDPCWSKRQAAIQSLNVRYKDIWKIIFEIDRENEENALREQNSDVFSKHYFPNLHKSFKEVFYPEGDPDAVLIRKRDIELLLPETFINDTIIDFYIKYLKNKIQTEEQHRFHFFNSFFFRKLADLDKYQPRACETSAAFQRVRKWTRKVDMFKKDYIFIPVNYSLHWSLIVICHPGEVANLNDDDLNDLPKVPCILHLDSIKGSHKGLNNLFQSYLCEEWKERHSGAADDISLKFFQLQFVPLELPQQENSFDCGLFLLHYVEHFIQDAPANFSPFKITKFSKFLTRNWFPPMEASLKRSHIQRLIYEVLKDQSYKTSSAGSIDEYPLFHSPHRSEKETGHKVLGEMHSSEQTSQDHSSSCNSQEGIKISRSGVSLQTSNQHIENSVAFEEFLKVGNYGRSFSDRNNQQVGTLPSRNAMSPIEEIEGTGEKIAVDASSDIDGQQVYGLQTSLPRARYTRRHFQALEPSWNQQDLLHVEDSCSGTSSSDFQVISEMGPEFEGSSHLGRTDKPDSSSTSSEYLADCVVEDSEDDASDRHNYCESKRLLSSFSEDIPSSSNQEAELKRNAIGHSAAEVVQVDE
ncbi:hypothetical protein SLE2022_120940 [Rubroshorea leprosula]